ncbi:MAG: hypothetical protein LUO84_05235 [Methanomassiliicoccales archaeon]|nr:hypothetical protein [Methanomassiliicoccales archaeon]
MNEFSLKDGKIRGGLFSAIGSILKYVIIPVIIFTVIASVLSAVSQFNENLGLKMVDDMRNMALILGLPIVFLSFFRGYYPKGSYSRLTFAIATTIMICVWIWFVMQGGKFQLSATRADLNMDLLGLVLLLVVVAAIGGLYFVAELFSYRKEYLARKVTPVGSLPGQSVIGTPKTDEPQAEQISSQDPPKD